MRNKYIEQTSERIIDEIDRFINGAKLKTIPSSKTRKQIDNQLNHKSGSVRLASMFLAFYSTIESKWEANGVPTGIRGQYGDKRVAQALAERHITLHKSITAFGENLGWKGNVENVKLSNDPRFGEFAKLLANSNTQIREQISEYIAYKFADSVSILKPLPPVSADTLTFARAKNLFFNLIAIPSEGHIQQLVLAALIEIYRKRHQIKVQTHHPHAADKFGGSAGDIEEYFEGELRGAYEVTVRPDWKNRLANFRDKMDRHGLQKYAIIAYGVNQDPDLNPPSSMIQFLESTGRDIAIIDIADAIVALCAELNAEELRDAVNRCYELLCNPKISGRDEFCKSFVRTVDIWIDQ